MDNGTAVDRPLAEFLVEMDGIMVADHVAIGLDHGGGDRPAEGGGEPDGKQLRKGWNGALHGLMIERGLEPVLQRDHRRGQTTVASRRPRKLTSRRISMKLLLNTR